MKDRLPVTPGEYFCFHESDNMWVVEFEQGNFASPRITHWLEELPADTTSARLPNDVEIEEWLAEFSEEDSAYDTTLKFMAWLRAGSPKTKA